MRFLAMTIGLLALVSPAMAAEPCAFKNAIYGQADTGFTLNFRTVAGVEGAAANMTNRFVVKAPTVSDEIDGEVYWPNGSGGDQTMITVAGCVASEDPDAGPACSVWDGKIYVLGDKTVSSMPGEDEPAPDTLLVANFGYASYYTLTQTGEPQVADDVFTLKGCAP